MCNGRKSKVNAGKSKAMVFGRENEVEDFPIPNRMDENSELNCKVRTFGELLGDVREHQYLVSVL